MNVHISYKVNKTPDIEKEIAHHLEKLQKRLQAFRPELVHLKGIIEQNSAREGFAVSLNLRLPSGQMAAQRSANTAAAVLKTGFDDLLMQLNKHKAQLRSSHKWPRWRRGVEKTVPTAVPFEETIASVHPLTVSSDDIRSYVNVNLGRLQRFVERELFFREVSGEIDPNSVTKDEIVDEVIALALGDGMEKPDRIAIEPWLYRLAIRTIAQASFAERDGNSEIHLEDSAWKPNVRASDEPALQYHQPDESLTGENVVADQRTATPEDIAYSDEMIALVQFALQGVKREEREVFILHAIEGFTVEEIAAITDHSMEKINACIAAGRAHLRKSPPIANRFKDKLLQKTGTA